MLNLSQIRKFAEKNIKGVTDGSVVDFRLEEAQVDSDGNWDVVISFLTEDRNPRLINKTNIFDIASQIQATQFERVFKRMLLDNEGNLIKLSRSDY